MKILTSEQMANIDRRSIEAFGIPSIVLMENAALAVVEVIERHYPDAGDVAIFCGTGNNGGDGLAVARHLHNHDFVVRIFIIGERAKLDGDPQIQLRICEQMEIPIEEITDDESLLEALAHASAGDLIVDAIFGTGLTRPPAGLHAEVIRSFPEVRLPVIAVDLPSGLNGSSGDVDEPVVEADLTVTFAQPKIAHIFSPAADYCGQVVVADISIPAAALEAEAVQLSLIRSEEVLPFIQPREADTHKGTFGHVALVCGSPGKSGAAIMSARSAVRGGAGLVTVVTDPETARVIDSVSIESMSLPIDLQPGSLDRIVEFVGDKDAVLVGPGLQDEEPSYDFIRQLVSRLNLPMVLDATAINAHRGRIGTLKPAQAARILTHTRASSPGCSTSPSGRFRPIGSGGETLRRRVRLRCGPEGSPDDRGGAWRPDRREHHGESRNGHRRCRRRPRRTAARNPCTRS